ncbi:MAG: cytidine deaminase [Metallosphaera sp.]|uniref:cytidine deaminase n=1 Tax=Metallosphaera cuprina (strain Ar-4) TaxID=1006006 RepID=F4G3D8_METCR|nr:cytidine deaminase [Metallosphaera cuprina]AEB94136.1 cytidine deaminase [Metallosphaera cuprina Ar-4]
MIDPSDEDLIEYALKASKNSYSPYSKIKVGAAILTETNDVITGTNVENASYGLSMCAERVAVFKAISMGIRKFRKIAIILDDGKGIMPCGACRQVLMEFGKDIIVITKDKDGRLVKFNLDSLLPNSFTLKGEEIG